MPKSPSTLKSSHPGPAGGAGVGVGNGSNKASSDEVARAAGSGGAVSDVAMRKKKNADAQAAFRARRANYITTLEETVTSLESVVLQLQESCREATADNSSLRQENERLRHELCEREKFWKSVWHSRRQGSESDEQMPMPPFTTTTTGPGSSSQRYHQLDQYNTNGGTGNESAATAAYSQTSRQSASSFSPSIPYAALDSHSTTTASQSATAITASATATATGVNNGSPASLSVANAGRPSKYGTYQYSSDTQWPQTISHSTSTGLVDPSGANSASSHSSNFAESPTLNHIDMSYHHSHHHQHRHGIQSSHINNNPTATQTPYAFPPDRSTSPTTSPTTSSTSLASQFPNYSYHHDSLPSGSADRGEYDYRSQNQQQEAFPHTGTTDMPSLAGAGSDAVRFRLGIQQRPSSGPLLPLPVMPDDPRQSHHHHQQTHYVTSSPPTGAPGLAHQMDNDDGGALDGGRYDHRRHSHTGGGGGINSSQPSRSPSPGSTPPLSGTLAVLKAQAFGALRRTRQRSKKSTEGAARVAADVLEARGIGIGGGVRISREIDDGRDDDEMDGPP